jgi:hypothetical protein
MALKLMKPELLTEMVKPLRSAEAKPATTPAAIDIRAIGVLISRFKFWKLLFVLDIFWMIFLLTKSREELITFIDGLDDYLTCPSFSSVEMCVMKLKTRLFIA